MAKVTIGQISSATSLDEADYLEIEHSGVSYKATLEQVACFATPCGAYVDMAYEKTVSATFPAVAVWDSDKTINVANYPILVPELRAMTASVTLTAGTIVTSIDVNATGGSILSSVNSAFTIMAAALLEEYNVQNAFSIAITIGGTEYTITSVSSTITISGTIATGATTMTVYPHRVSGTSATAIVFKDSGRVLMTHDGKTYISGFRRRDRMQGHWHDLYSGAALALGGGTGSWDVFAPTVSRSVNSVRSPVTDGVNGTPRTGSTTDPNMSVVYRYLWAQVYTP